MLYATAGTALTALAAAALLLYGLLRGCREFVTECVTYKGTEGKTP